MGQQIIFFLKKKRGMQYQLQEEELHKLMLLDYQVVAVAAERMLAAVVLEALGLLVEILQLLVIQEVVAVEWALLVIAHLPQVELLAAMAVLVYLLIQLGVQ
jgi:hypothetical protein